MPYLDLESIRMYYTVHGAEGRETVILLHGLGSCGEDWMLQIPVLEGDYRVLTPDLRGHGQSSLGAGWPTVADMARDVGDLLDALQAGPAHVVGLSLGGAVALQLAVDRPDQVRSLAAVNTFARLRTGLKGLPRVLGRIALVLIGDMKRVGQLVAAGIFPRPEQQALREIAAARIAANPRSAYLRVLWAVMRFDLRPRLAEVRAPTLVVAGEADTTVPMQAKRELARRIAGARLAVVPNSGHVTPLDAPQAFNSLLLEFLAGAGGQD